MKKKIAILGSTGSIGKTTFNILKKDKKNFEIVLLTTDKNIKVLFKQTKVFNVKNLIIKNKKFFLKSKKKFKNKKINIFNNFNSFNKTFKSKIDYTMCSISGIAGLKPTLNAIAFSKTVAIANKEALICGWNLIESRLKKYKTTFIPVDSEHFSIWSLIKGSKNDNIEKIIITASGGPFLNSSLKLLSNVNPKAAIKHPNWSMGKKISVDSATMMNKVFEVIEAQRIFNINFNKFKILIHPKSYVHAIVKFSSGLIKVLIHDTNMRIPIFNTIYNEKNKKIITKDLNINLLNNLNFTEVNKKKFPVVDILKKIPQKNSLFETILVSSNDKLVDMFFKKKIKFIEISKFLRKILSLKEFQKYKHIKPKNFNQIANLDKFVRLKIETLRIL